MLSATRVLAANDEMLMGSFVLSGTTSTVTSAITVSTFNAHLESNLADWMGNKTIINATTAFDQGAKHLSVSFVVRCPANDVQKVKNLIATGGVTADAQVVEAHAAAAGSTTFSDSSLVVVWNQCVNSTKPRTGGIAATQAIGTGDVLETCSTGVTLRVSSTISVVGQVSTICNAMFQGDATRTGRDAEIATCIARTTITTGFGENGFLAVNLNFAVTRSTYYTLLFLSALREERLNMLGVVEVGGLFTQADGTLVSGALYSTFSQSQATKTIVTCADKMKWLAFLILLGPLYIVIGRAVYAKGKETGAIQHEKNENLAHERLLKLAAMQREAAGGAQQMMGGAGMATQQHQQQQVPPLQLNQAQVQQTGVQQRQQDGYTHQGYGQQGYTNYAQAGYNTNDGSNVASSVALQ